jgi:hypothetical protein
MSFEHMIFKNLLHKHDCPCCQKSLRLRILPHVTSTEASISFSCVHCKTILTYNKPDGPLGQYLATRKLAGIPLERFVIVISFTLAWMFLDRATVRIVLLALIGGLLINYLFTPHRAYKVIGNCPPTDQK